MKRMTPDENPSEREQRVAQLLRQAAISERAPQRLREQVSSPRARERASTRRQLFGTGARQALAASAAGGAAAGSRATPVAPAVRPGRRWSLVAAPLALVVLVLVVSFAKSGPAAPTIAQAASLAALSPASAAPKPDSADPHALLTAAVQGLHFPNWSSYGGWRASGERRDEIRGRAVTTVFYRRGPTQLAYSIVATPALLKTGTGPGAYEVFHKGARTYVVWTVSGHTCLVSGVHVSAATLWRLAKTTTEA